MVAALRVAARSRRISSEAFEAADAARRARDAEAREAARAVAEARAEADEIRRLAREAGREEGRAEGLACLCAVLARLEEERDLLLAGAEEELVELAFAVAHAVLAGWAERDREVVVETARRALAAARGRAGLTLRAHPDDAQALQQALEREPGRVPVSVRADPGVERGGVLLEAGEGLLDATFSAGLRALRQAAGDRLR